MNTKKIFFAVVAAATLLVASCTSNTASDDTLYEQGIDKTIITKQQGTGNG
ncbi:peptidase m28 [Sediminicola sp. YIK13]|uniref:peptidase m28 n=1 Tax=Sediminicola sp. YIK13 TaxID=1453352 RepID=UPI0011A05BCB|nr:peptidase m28 [Sediminicola sp. YIK13]